ncbi:4-amino-4-deoxy-L-arabinose-phosphoundecaprenol flippase subunit ArnE [uncultured archaeon]|nr:4-amino-4-deoxy-L-arabinose-phosphoundecaprenol flippase subunit ArnE [uncultured archaeon]
MTTQFIGVGLILVASVFAAYGALSLKRGSEALKKGFISLIRDGNFLVGVLFYGVSTVFYLSGLRFGDLSMLYPVSSTSYIWVSFLSVRHLNEKMNNYKWAAIVFILLGVSLIGLSGR